MENVETKYYVGENTVEMKCVFSLGLVDSNNKSILFNSVQKSFIFYFLYRFDGVQVSIVFF